MRFALLHPGYKSTTSAVQINICARLASESTQLPGHADLPPYKRHLPPYERHLLPPYERHLPPYERQYLYLEVNPNTNPRPTTSL